MDVELLLRTSSFLLAALLLTRVFYRAAAATRHLIWHMAVIAVLLAPALVLIAPRFTVPLPSLVTEAAPSESGTAAIPDIAARPCAPGGSDCGVRADAFVSAGLSAIAQLAGVGTWIVGAWFLLGWLATAWQAARATEAPLEWVTDAHRLGARLGFSQTPVIRQARDPGSPRVAGLLQPVIILPSTAREWGSADREAALLHELSHIRRADRRTQALAQLTCALYWFNPLVWIAAANLARERERACDDEVLKAGVRPSAYASLLLDLAKGEHPWTPAAAIGMARPSTIEGRLLAILAIEPEGSAAAIAKRRLGSRRSTRWLVISGTALLATAILGAQSPQTSSPADPATAGAAKPAIPRLMNLDDRASSTPITQALSRALNDPDRQVREKAAFALALVPGSETIDPLLTALRDSDAQVREKAAIGLAFRRDARVVDPLLEAMGDADAQVREKVAIALGASGDPRALSALEKALSDPDSQVREKAASGIVLLALRK